MAIKNFDTSTQIQGSLHVKRKSLDGTSTVEYLSDLLTLINNDFVYNGKLVYVEEKDTHYKYRNGEFKPFESGENSGHLLDLYELWVLIAGNENKTMELFYDSLKGDNGKSSYEEWLLLEGNADKTILLFYEYLQLPALNIVDEVNTTMLLVETILSNIDNSTIISTIEDGFFMIDEKDNIGLSFTPEGFDSTSVTPHFLELFKSYIIDISSLLGYSFFDVVEDGFYITDENYNAGFSITNAGLDVGALTPHFRTLISNIGGDSGSSGYSYNVTDYGININNANNNTAFQALIDLVSDAGGGEILFPTGTFNFVLNGTGKIIIMKDNITIKGSGFSTVLRVSGHSPGGDSLFYYIVAGFTKPIVNCHFRDLMIDQTDCTTSGYTTNGKAIFFQDLKDCSFKNIILKGSPASALGIDYLRNVIIDGIQCIDCGRKWTNGSYGGAGIGIGSGLYEDESFQIINNICDNCGQYGIFIETQSIFGHADNAAKANIIANNIIKNGRNTGIGLRGGNYVNISGNIVYNNVLYGIYIERSCNMINVNNNIILDNGNHGIYLASYSTVPNANNYYLKSIKIINNNISSNNGCGIKLYSLATSYISNASIISNTINQNSSYGIYLLGISLNTCITSNNTSGNIYGLYQSAQQLNSFIQSNLFVDYTIPSDAQSNIGSGTLGASAYEIWLSIPENNDKTVELFIEDITGSDGDSAYTLWLSVPDNEGKSFNQYLDSLKGTIGASAYESWLTISGNENKTLLLFIDSLSIISGADSYAVWLELEGNAGKSKLDYIDAIKLPALLGAIEAINIATSMVNTAISNLSPSPISFKDLEELCGTYNIAGKTKTIYGCTFVLENLPKILDETIEFDISDQPLGFNLFINVDKLIISTSGVKVSSDFFTSIYEVIRIYVNTDCHTIVEIKCKLNTNIDYIVQLKLLYIKFYGDVIEFDVTVPEGVNTSNVNLSFPRLKYNKTFLCSYSMDDCSVHFYDRIFTLINNLPVNPIDGTASYVHVGLNIPSDNIRPNKTLGYTDGCGIYHRFLCGMTVWANNYTGAGTPYMGTTVPTNYSQPYIRWTDIPLLLDFGWTLYQHDIGDDFDDTNVDSIVAGFKVDQDKTKLLSGRAQKIVMEPNGNDNYYPAVVKSPLMYMICSQSNTPNFYPMTDDIDLYDKNMKRRFLPLNTWEEEVAYILDSVYILENKPWYHLASHTPGIIVQGTLLELCRLYGEEGNDTIWFPTVDEYFEYCFMIRNTEVVKTVNGLTIHYKMYVPTDDNFYYRSMTVNLSGINSLTDLTVVSDSNCYGTSYAIKNDKLMINLDFNTTLLLMAEKYVSKFEFTLNLYDYVDALYFVNKLKVGIKESFETRLNNSSSLELDTFIINNNDEITNGNIIALIITYTGTPTHYKVSELSDMSLESWISWVEQPSFTLSSGDGIKTVYLQLKNDIVESSVLSDSITLNSAALDILSVSINSGAVGTSSNNISVYFTSAGAVPTHYKIGEESDLINASWVTYIDNTISYTLSEGYTSKTVYILIKTDTEISSIASDSITVIEPLTLTSVIVNGGDISTENSSVTIAITSAGSTPTHYMASESSSFTGASWIAYSSSFPFALSSGEGTKTIYIKIKNDYFESISVYDTINRIIIEAAVSAIVSFAGASNEIVYNTLTDGTVINYLGLSVSSTFSSKQFQTKTGELVPWYFEGNSALYVADSETTEAGKYLNGTAGQLPTLSGDTGVVPDMYLAKVHNTTGNCSDGTKKGKVMFTLPVGTYTMKILESVSTASAITEAQRVSCFYKLNANGVAGTPVVVGPSGFTAVANVQYNAETNFTVSEAGTGNVILYIYNTANINYKPGVSALEITKTA